MAGIGYSGKYRRVALFGHDKALFVVFPPQLALLDRPRLLGWLVSADSAMEQQSPACDFVLLPHQPV
jgi:hypothetical protein